MVAAKNGGTIAIWAGTIGYGGARRPWERMAAPAVAALRIDGKHPMLPSPDQSMHAAGSRLRWSHKANP
jgi:hypothetical protein